MKINLVTQVLPYVMYFFSFFVSLMIIEKIGLSYFFCGMFISLVLVLLSSKSEFKTITTEYNQKQIELKTKQNIKQIK